MEPELTRPFHETADGLDPVHEWPVWRLARLGVPWSAAQAAADHVDWHQA